MALRFFEVFLVWLGKGDASHPFTFESSFPSVMKYSSLNVASVDGNNVLDHLARTNSSVGAAQKAVGPLLRVL